MKVFSDDGWNDYTHWAEANPEMLHRVNQLLEDSRRHLFKGLGKPESLTGGMQGWWSRRVTGDHRLVYRIDGSPGPDQRIVVAACRYHYSR